MAQVVPGAEAWSAQGSGPNARVGFLLVHGFTGSPGGLRDWAEQLADRGYAVELPRLPGHGTRWQEMNKTTWRDWTREAVAAFERLRARTDSVFVGGLSMGACISLHLAETRGEDIAGLVLVNPAVFHRDPLKRLLPLLKLVVPSTPGIANDIAREGGDELAYSRSPLKAAASLFQLQDMVRRNLPSVTVPTLIFTSRQDHVVDNENSRIVKETIGSTDVEQRWLERSYHVATVDHDLPLIVEGAAEFAQRVAGVAR